MNKIYYLIACLLLCFVHLNAQKKQRQSKLTNSETLVEALFAPNTTLKWVKTFSGRMDDVSDIDILLGFDGTHCKGFLTYKESKTKLTLDGILDGEKLSLCEIDAHKDTSGFLKGNLVEKTLKADWTNFNNSIGSYLVCEEITSEIASFSHCGDNKWINKYSISYNGGNFEIILCRSNNGLLFGNSWIETGNLYYNLKGEIKDDGDFFVNLIKNDGSDAGSFQGNMQNKQTLGLDWATQAGKHQFFNFPLVETLSVGCYEFADYTNSYDVLFPKSRCVPCNVWMERKVAVWLTKCKGSFASNPQKENPSNRAAQRASAWTDISLWNEDLFCGTLTFTESWADDANGISFNFDLNTGKEITFEDIFIKKFDARTWLEDYEKKEIAKLPMIADKEFKNWIETEGFPLFLLQRDGVVLATPFHPVFGQQRISIPYSVLKPYLKKENPVAIFVK
jgi:hypothetical protein